MEWRRDEYCTSLFVILDVDQRPYFSTLQCVSDE